MEIHRIWVSEGKPHSGHAHTERLRIRALYKCAIKEAQRAPKQQSWNKLHSALTESDTQKFWNSWRSLYSSNKSQFPPVVNGCSSKQDIANKFKRVFHANSMPNNPDQVAIINARFHEAYDEYARSHSLACDCCNHTISVQLVFDAIQGMKDGKCAGADGISAEHLKNAPILLFHRLSFLLNGMLRHSFVPDQFKKGFMLPLVKDPQGNLSDASNYRGITISPVISKVLEHVLKDLFSEFLQTSTLQFGFKKKSSTIHALYCLKQTVAYYIEHKSNVYCSFLDASKAFDRLVHAGLFLKMIERRIPMAFLNIIMYWHDGLSCQVKWDDHFSDWFQITAGVRQGGVLSPDFYCLYIDDLIGKLQSLGVGCYIRNIFAAALFYADDMAVLSPSLKGLQKLLDVCSEYCIQWDIKLNAKKTKNIVFGSKNFPTHCVTLDGNEIPWEQKCKYLGVTLVSGSSFSCCTTETTRRFYRALNSILRIEGRSDDMVMLRLLEAHCIPILTYGVETIHVKDVNERRQMRVAYNAVYRKMFGYSYRESVTLLQHSLGRSTWEELVEKKKSDFQRRICSCPSDSLVRAFHVS